MEAENGQNLEPEEMLSDDERRRLDDKSSVVNESGLNDSHIPKPNFPDTRSWAKDLYEKYFDLTDPSQKENSAEREENLTQMLEYFKAGKNLSNFCHHLSHREKKPVLTINNARCGALYQLGFDHWLANFENRDQAKTFIQELDLDDEYKELFNNLKQKISEFRNFLETDVKPNQDNGSQEKVDEFLVLNDPTADVKTELLYIDNSTLLDRYYIKLAEIQQLKDELRSIIFKHAKQWLDSQKINSFVFPINHFKLSGSGTNSWELNNLENKLINTYTKSDMLLVFADYHGKRSTHFGVGGLIGQIKYRNKAHTDNNNYPAPNRITNLLANSNTISGRLLYPYKESPSNPYRNLLSQSKKADAKLIDLHVMLPTQGGEDDYWTYRKNNTIEDELFDPQSVEAKNDFRLKQRKIINDLKQTPEWIHDFDDTIPIEPNYTYGGPADIKIQETQRLAKKT